MSMPGPWDLEERVEDAIVGYLRREVGETAHIVAARTLTVARYPLVVVEVTDSDNDHASGPMDGRRRLSAVVAITTEALNLNTGPGARVGTMDARDAHRAIKASVIQALAGDTVHADLNAMEPEGVAFSQCHATRQDRDAGDGKMVTEQTLDILAQPQEIGT